MCPKYSVYPQSIFRLPGPIILIFLCALPDWIAVNRQPSSYSLPASMCPCLTCICPVWVPAGHCIWRLRWLLCSKWKPTFSQVVLEVLYLKNYWKLFSWAFVTLFFQSYSLPLPYNLKFLVYCCDFPSSSTLGQLMYKSLKWVSRYIVWKG